MSPEPRPRPADDGLRRSAAAFNHAIDDRLDRLAQRVRPIARVGRVEAAADDGLPTIDATDQDLPRVTEQAIGALVEGNRPPALFVFGGAPTRVERDERGTPVLRPLTEDRLRHHAARWAHWTRPGARGQILAALPPMHVVRDLLAHPDLPLPPLVRIVEAPVFDRCGTLCRMPGYAGEISGLYVAPAPGWGLPEVPDAPTNAEVAAARVLLRDDLLGDFPFVGDAEAAHAIALLLLPFARDLITGPTPMHLIEKPAPGTGGGLLVDALLWSAIGRSVPVMTEGRDEDEWRKRLTAKLVASPTVILIDNLRRRLDSPALSGALTATVWEDRILSVSSTMRVPVRCVWIATGNNPALSNEITRRTIRIRLDAGVDRPWLREGFRHPDLRDWMTVERTALVRAALILVQSWLVAGRPMGNRTMGQYESWARVMGGILEHVGIPGFLGNLTDFYAESDAESSMWTAFVLAWADKYSDRAAGVADLFALLSDDVTLDLGDKGERSQRTRLGKLIGSMRDRVFAGYRIVQAEPVRGAQRWRLKSQDGER